MTKLFTHPLTKLLFWGIGYAGMVSALRSVSHTLNMLFHNIFGGSLHFGLWPAVVLMAASLGLLALSTWKTKPKKVSPLLVLWRKADAFLLVLFTLWVLVFSLMYTISSWGIINRDILATVFFPATAYGLIAILVTELTARAREGALTQSFYFLHFFRKNPIYKPLGFSFALLLLVNGLVLLSVMTAPFHFRHIGGIRAHLFFPWGVQTLARDISNWLLGAAAASLVALNYFAVYLQNLASQYEKANIEKIQAERFKSELITNVSHDIRTPLTSIINYVDLLKTQPLAGKAEDYVGVLEKKSARLKVLIDDLMEASKVGTGNVALNWEKINFSELLGQIAGEFDEAFAQQGLSLVLREPEQTLYITADSRHLWRILENLFSNGGKYSLGGTRVFAEIKQAEKGITFSLKNTSKNPIELGEEALAQQFIRGDLARESEGSGLGLYIAKSLVELMDGQFSIGVSGDQFEVSFFLKNSEQALPSV